MPTTLAPKSAVLTRVLERASQLRTYSFDATIHYETTDGGGGLAIGGSGAADVAADLTEWKLTQSAAKPHLSNSGSLTFSKEPVAESMILTSERVYDRLGGSPPVAHDWCWRNPKKRPGPQLSPTDTLAMLAKSGRTVSEIGTTIVRGVSTTHYAVSGASRALPVDIWVDSTDQLRRIELTQTGTTYVQTTTTDLFDFDLPVTIKVPITAPACP